FVAFVDATLDLPSAPVRWAVLSEVNMPDRLGSVAEPTVILMAPEMLAASPVSPAVPSGATLESATEPAMAPSSAPAMTTVFTAVTVAGEEDSETECIVRVVAAERAAEAM